MDTSNEESPAIALEFHTADIPLYRLKMFINLVLATGANSLAFVLIVWASPKQIHVYRWFLLDILMTAFCMDLYFMVVLQPFALLPVPGYCALGLASFAGTFFGGFIGVTILFFLLGSCAAAVFSAALYRLFAIYDLQRKMLGPVGIALIVGAHLFISSPVQLGAAFVIQQVADQQPIRAQIYESYPGVREMLNSSEVCVFALMDEDSMMRLTVYIAIVILLLVGIAGISIIVIGFVSLVRRKSKISARLYRMHRQLSYSLLIQILVPGVMLYLPFFLLAISLFFQLEILKIFVQVYTGTFSAHSTLNAIAMVTFTRPYRQALFRWCLRSRFVQMLMKRTAKGKQLLAKMATKQKQVFATEMGKFGANNKKTMPLDIQHVQQQKKKQNGMMMMMRFTDLVVRKS